MSSHIDGAKMASGAEIILLTVKAKNTVQNIKRKDREKSLGCLFLIIEIPSIRITPDTL